MKCNWALKILNRYAISWYFPLWWKRWAQECARLNNLTGKHNKKHKTYFSGFDIGNRKQHNMQLIRLRHSDDCVSISLQYFCRNCCNVCPGVIAALKMCWVGRRNEASHSVWSVSQTVDDEEPCRRSYRSIFLLEHGEWVYRLTTYARTHRLTWSMDRRKRNYVCFPFLWSSGHLARCYDSHLCRCSHGCPPNRWLLRRNVLVWDSDTIRCHLQYR